MKRCHRPGRRCLWPAEPLPCIPAPRTFLLRRCRLPTRVCRQLSICLCATTRTCVLFTTHLCCSPFKCDQSPTELDTNWTNKKSSDFKWSNVTVLQDMFLQRGKRLDQGHRGIQWQSCEQNPNLSPKPALCHNYHASFRLKTVPSVYKSLYTREKDIFLIWRLIFVWL